MAMGSCVAAKPWSLKVDPSLIPGLSGCSRSLALMNEPA